MTVPEITPDADVNEKLPPNELGPTCDAPRVTVRVRLAPVMGCAAAVFSVTWTGASGVREYVHVVPTAGAVDSDAAPLTVGPS